MKYTSKTWESTTDTPSDGSFLSPEAKSFLEKGEPVIYTDWETHFPSDKSIANVLSRTILTQFDSPGFAISPQISSSYGVMRAFHHRSSTSDLFVEIFRLFNHAGLKDFLILTQSSDFKRKFLYDSATMTVDTLIVDYSDFLHAVCISDRPRLFFLIFDDLDFDTDVLVRGTRKYLKLLNKEGR